MFPTAIGFRPAPAMLSSAEMFAGVCEFAEIAKADGVTVALCGGAAMHCYGGDRLTSDLDFVAREVPPSLPVESALTFGGAATRTPSGISVDVIVRDDEHEALYLEALGCAITVPGMPVRVVRAEHLAAMKMVAGRDKDQLDLGYLLTAAGFDRVAARKIVKKHLGADGVEEFESLCAEADWKAGKR